MTGDIPGAHLDRLAGSLTGLLVGDALGVPYEFHSADSLSPAELIEFQPPAGFRRSHRSVPPGTWSDDGAQALVLLDSLLSRQRLDLGHFSDGLGRWMAEGFCAVDDEVFDVGIQTGRALACLANGIEPREAGPREERDNGNGSLMRVLPVPLWHRGTDYELVELSSEQSLPTHGHMRSRIACALYSLWVRCVLEERLNPWDAAVARLKHVAHATAFDDQELGRVLDPANASCIEGSGYVVNSLWSARAAVLETSSFEECVRRAVAFGNDTDTTAAIAGGVAGAMYGLAGIPRRWRMELRGSEILQPLQAALLAHHQPQGKSRGTTKTSLSHPIQIATLPVGQGKIGITFCPGKKQTGAMSGTWERDLVADLAAICNWGASDIVSLIEADEMTSLGVEELPEIAKGFGMRWHHLPIVDQQAPNESFEHLWTEIMEGLKNTLSKGGSVLVHCKGGLGRAGTVAARLLMAANPTLSSSAAIAMVRAVRPGAVETYLQEQYLRTFEPH